MALSAHTSKVLGGSISNPTTFDATLRAAIALLRSQHDRPVSLGDLIELRLGVSRHRSILFKYLCDHMHRFPAQWGLSAASQSDGSGSSVVRGAIPCQLVRGVQSVSRAADGSDVSQSHMWNVVQLGSELFVVDVMQHPGQLLAAESQEAQAYQRAIHASAEPSGVQPQVLTYPLLFPLLAERTGEACAGGDHRFDLCLCECFVAASRRQSRAGGRRASLDCVCATE